MTSPIVVPERQSIIRPWWIPTPEAEAEQRRILSERFFLVRIGGNGQRWICSPKKGGCGGYHRYLTLRCAEQPFSGLTRGLFAYWSTVGAYGARNHLSARERSRYDDIGRMLGSLPDLASAHPETARSVGTGDHDADVGAYTFTATELSAAALGVVEPIDRERAARLARRINMRGIKPPFVLEGLNDGE